MMIFMSAARAAFSTTSSKSTLFSSEHFHLRGPIPLGYTPRVYTKDSRATGFNVAPNMSILYKIQIQLTFLKIVLPILGKCVSKLPVCHFFLKSNTKPT